MRLIWTKSKLPLSVLIRWGLSEPVSHFGIVFDNGIVFHSNLLGTHVEWFGTFAKHCEIVYSVECQMELLDEEAVYRDILDTYDDKGYDYCAFAYFCLRGFMRKFLRIPFPEKSAWTDKDKFLCTELAGTLPESIIGAQIKAEDLSILSPYQLYLQVCQYRIREGL